MNEKPTYEELEQRIRGLEKEMVKSKLAGENLEKDFRMRETLLDNIPGCSALIIKKGSREIVASNKFAQDLGAVPGLTCFKTSAKRDDSCPFCLAPQLWATDQLQRLEVEYRGTWYEGIWVPLSEDLYVHYIFDITDRKQADYALRESEERQRQIIENSSAGYFFVDREGRFQKVNSAWLRLHKYETAEEIIGRHFSFTQVETDLPQAQDSVRDLLDGGDIIAGEFSRRCRDGSIGYHTFSASAVRKEGEIIGLEGFLIDISDRKRAEETLRKNEEKYKSLFENMQNGFALHEMVFDEAGKPIDFIFLDVNETFEKQTNLNKEKLIGRKVTEALPGIENDPIDWISTCGKVVLTGNSISFENYSEQLDRWYSVVAYRPDEGRFATIFHDITDRKQAEEALRESEEKYRTILDEIDEGYFEVDLTGRFTFVSDWFLQVAGSSRDELLTMDNRDYMTPESAKEVYSIFTKLVRTRVPVKNVGHEIVTPKGEHRHHELSASLVRDGEGNAIGFRGTTRDVSERIKAEEERAKLEAQLQQAQKMESIGTLAGGIAHNFNNVLMGIQGRTSLMLVDKDGSHFDFEHLKGIEEYVQNAAELTKDLLGFARGGKYEPRPVDLNELIKHENLMFGRTKKEITLRGKYSKDLWTVEVDQGQIRQTLLNLYVNSWQAMPEGGDLYIQTENVALEENYVKSFKITPGRYVKISVTDTGVGMDEATREKIFDPFFTTQGVGVGTGLGLASVYGIVKNHGGFINVYSEKGVGTTFNIYLPASEKEFTEEKKTAGEVVEGEGTILIVDDEEMITDVSALMMEKLGYRVLTAKSGQEAIDVYGKNMDDIGLVILDMIMPGMSGGETYDRLKEINPDMKVLLSSGYSVTGQAREILDRGCNGFIQKPFSLKDISQIIRELLDS